MDVDGCLSPTVTMQWHVNFQFYLHIHNTKTTARDTPNQEGRNQARPTKSAHPQTKKSKTQE